MPETWEGSYETDLAMRRPIEAQFQHILNFIQNHDDLLHRVDEKRNNLLEEKTPYRPIRIALDAPERVTPYDMLYNDDDKNSSVRKTLMVLVFLSDEIHELKEIAEERFFPLLVIFGRSPLDNEGQILISQHSLFTVSTSTLPRTSQFSIMTAICCHYCYSSIHCFSIYISVLPQLSSAWNCIICYLLVIFFASAY